MVVKILAWGPEFSLPYQDELARRSLSGQAFHFGSENLGSENMGSENPEVDRGCDLPGEGGPAGGKEK